MSLHIAAEQSTVMDLVLDSLELGICQNADLISSEVKYPAFRRLSRVALTEGIGHASGSLLGPLH